MIKTKRIVALSTLAMLLACQTKQEVQQQEAVEEYPVEVLQIEKTTLFNDYPVTLQGVKEVELRPKIDGFIEQILVDEGQEVKKGQLLFRIYAPQYKEENAAAIANLNRAEAELNEARMKVAKTKPLVEQNIVSAYELETAQYTEKTKEALVMQARANVSSAGANVGYTQIVAPFDGIIGLIPYKEGALVGSNSIEPLTVISDISAIYAYLSMNEKQFFDFLQENQASSVKERIALLPEVQLILANGQVYAKKGKVNTVSGQLDPLTGSINFRALFDNQEGVLRSGNSATVRVYEEVGEALLVPQRATYDLQGKRFVYVVGEDGRVKSREIKVMERTPSSEFYILTSGVQRGEKIVTAGIGGLKDGVQIKL
jgi:membrane fusion protein (multidrug efflux system)